MEQPLRDKVALITGAGQPLGAAIALALAQAGATIVIADLNPDRAERTAQAIRHQGGHATVIIADVANKFQCVNVIETARTDCGRIDILINATRVRPTAPLLKMDEWDWVRTLEVNLKGVFFMSQLCGRVFSNQNELTSTPQGGLIINLADNPFSPDRPLNQSAYYASQAALASLTQECGRELAEHHVAVHLLLTDGLTTEDAAARVVALCLQPDMPARS